MLRSAVGKTGSQPIKFALARHTGVQVPVISCHRVTWSFLDQSQSFLHNFGTFQFLPTGLHGLCIGFCFAGPLPLRSLTHGPLLRVRFGESLVFRLYWEIDHIHRIIEAQCVSHHLPPVDCHISIQHIIGIPISNILVIYPWLLGITSLICRKGGGQNRNPQAKIFQVSMVLWLVNLECVNTTRW